MKVSFEVYGAAMFKDFFSVVTSEFFMREVKYQSVFSYDKEFQFTPISLRFEHRSSDAVHRKSEKYLDHLKRVSATLPADITVKTKEKERVDCIMKLDT